MNSELALRLVLGIVLITLTAMELYYLRMTRKMDQAGAEEVRDTTISSYLPTSLIDAGLLAVGIYAIFPQWMAWSGLALPAWLRWIGAGLSVGGVLLRGWAHAALDRNYSWKVMLRKEHILITCGPYSRVRHPMYTAGLMIAIGLFILSASWFIGLLLLVPMIIATAWRIGSEESMLINRFGEEYRNYMKRTGRFLPRV